ncbi:conjugal transfer protein TraO [Chryseobacterium sp. NKUCC03_KSP]|uniref:conjugal transfer protein TraO n=1 Tax=Chryseobacterium sp. NKUCC03_KSP TaxID=2842125 RepID=UPI001C5BE67F|nr:conjugal transfer protein TraO [Chryseobacterium sp. NKUCC03_KSP]MBW3522891.1 conjugal transfer protein TraO [Chryseobacterium sp. NKUCC03_KSP]
MKRLHFYIIGLFLISFMGKAQRLIPKLKAIELNAGLLLNNSTNKNYFISTGLTIQAGKGNYSFFGFEYLRESKNYKTVAIPIDTYIAEAGYSLNLLADRNKNILVNFSISAVAGFENINKAEELLFDGAMILNESNFVYGAGGKISVEVYVSDRLVLVPHIKTKVLWNISRDLFRPSAGFGIRINL